MITGYTWHFHTLVVKVKPNMSRYRTQSHCLRSCSSTSRPQRCLLTIINMNAGIGLTYIRSYSLVQRKYGLWGQECAPCNLHFRVTVSRVRGWGIIRWTWKCRGCLVLFFWRRLISLRLEFWKIFLLLLLHWHYSTMRAFASIMDLLHNGPPLYPSIPWLLHPVPNSAFFYVRQYTIHP